MNIYHTHIIIDALYCKCVIKRTQTKKSKDAEMVVVNDTYKYGFALQLAPYITMHPYVGNYKPDFLRLLQVLGLCRDGSLLVPSPPHQ